LDESKFYTQDSESQMTQYKHYVDMLSEWSINWIIEMLNFHKFTSTNAALLWYNPATNTQAKILNAELKWILRTIDYFIEFFAQWLPDKSIKTDVLTWKWLDDLNIELTKDFTQRQEYIKSKILEFAKAAQEKNWQTKETTQDIQQ